MRPAQGPSEEAPSAPTLLASDRRHQAGPPLPEDAPRWHLLEVHWEAFRPLARFADGRGGLASVDLATLREASLDIEVEPGTFCAGRLEWRDEPPTHVPCPRNRAVALYPTCSYCSPLPDQGHVFEPTDPSCGCAACVGRHEVYVAFYGALPKVGLTRRARQRLIEQGADATLVAAVEEHRYAARQREKEISAALAIPQARRAQDLVRGFVAPPPKGELEAAAGRISERLRREFGLEPAPWEVLDGYPIPAAIGRTVLAPTEGRHRGRLLGVKGPLAALATPEGPLEAFRLGAAEGHWLRVAEGTALGEALEARLRS